MPLSSCSRPQLINVDACRLRVATCDQAPPPVPAQPELAVLDARLYIRVRRIDQPAESCGACSRSGSQLHMAHELAGALQQAGRIRQCCALKEPHVYVRSEYIHVAERRISQTCNGTAVMH